MVNSSRLTEFQEYLVDFPNREQGLRALTRYSLYSTMRYRSHLWGHARHVFWFVEELATLAQIAWKDFDTDRALLMALIHDDFELVMGDIQSGDKQNMTKAQLAELHQTEVKAVAATVGRFPRRAGRWEYGGALIESWQAKTIESQVVKLADKWDAFGEALHEAFGGNPIFSIPIRNEFGLAPTPYQQYPKVLKQFPENYPDLAQLYQQRHPFLLAPSILDFAAIALNCQPHTAKELAKPTGYIPYDSWKNLLIMQADAEEWHYLLEVRE